MSATIWLRRAAFTAAGPFEPGIEDAGQLRTSKLTYAPDLRRADCRPGQVDGTESLRERPSDSGDSAGIIVSPIRASEGDH